MPLPVLPPGGNISSAEVRPAKHTVGYGPGKAPRMHPLRNSPLCFSLPTYLLSFLIHSADRPSHHSMPPSVQVVSFLALPEVSGNGLGFPPNGFAHLLREPDLFIAPNDSPGRNRVESRRKSARTGSSAAQAVWGRSCSASSKSPACSAQPAGVAPCSGSASERSAP